MADQHPRKDLKGQSIGERSSRVKPRTDISRRTALQTGGVALATVAGMSSVVSGETTDEHVLNVWDYGAVGDGVTDDSAAIQEAINDAESGDTVFIPPTPHDYVVSTDHAGTGAITINGDKHPDDLSIVGDRVPYHGDEELEWIDSSLRLADHHEWNAYIIRVMPNMGGITGLEVRGLRFDGDYENQPTFAANHRLFNVTDRHSTADSEDVDIRVVDCISEWATRECYVSKYGNVTFDHCTARDSAGHGWGTDNEYQSDAPVIMRNCLAERCAEVHWGHYAIDISGGWGIIEDSVLQDSGLGTKTTLETTEATYRRVRIDNNEHMGYQRAGTGQFATDVYWEDVVISNNGGRSIRANDRDHHELAAGSELVITGNRGFPDIDVVAQDDVVFDASAEGSRVWVNNSSATERAIGPTGTASMEINHLSVGENENEDYGASNNASLTIHEIDNEIKTDLDNVPTEDEVGAFVNWTDTVPDFEVTISETTSPVAVMNPLAVDVLVENVGDGTGRQPITLEVDGTVVDRVEVPLLAGTQASLTLTWLTRQDDIGDHSVVVTSVDDEQSVEVSVDEGPIFEVDLASAPAQVGAGDDATIEITITNTGQTGGTTDARLLANKAEVDSSSVSLEPGESETVSLVWDTSEVELGEHVLTADSGHLTAETTVTVVEPAELAITVQDRNDPIQAGSEFRLLLTVTNDGVATADTDVTLAINDHVVDTSAVELAGDASTDVSLSWSSDPTETGTQSGTVQAGDATEDIEIEVAERSEFQLELWSMNDPIDPGDTLELEVGVINTGAAWGQREISLVVNDDTVDTTVAEVGGGSIGEVQLRWETAETDIGTFTITVRSDEAEITEELTLGEPAVYAVSMELSETTVDVGDTIDITVGATNTGKASGNQDLVLSADGEVIHTEEQVALAASETFEETVSYEVGEDVGSSFQITFSSEDDEASATVSVTDPGAADTDDDADGLPGFGIGSAVASIGGLGYLLKRRQRED